jgi:hypothetical protein
MSKVEYFNTKYLGQYKSMNDDVAAYIIDHVDWTPQPPSFSRITKSTKLQS